MRYVFLFIFSGFESDCNAQIKSEIQNDLHVRKPSVGQISGNSGRVVDFNGSESWRCAQQVCLEGHGRRCRRADYLRAGEDFL